MIWGWGLGIGRDSLPIITVLRSARSVYPGNCFSGAGIFGDSIIDMSYLVEKPAGKHGFLKRQGKDFVFEDGTPVKFWGVDAGMTETIESQHRQARFYAKHGINMLRQHPVQSVLGVLQSGSRSRRSRPWRSPPRPVHIGRGRCS